VSWFICGLNIDRASNGMNTAHPASLRMGRFCSRRQEGESCIPVAGKPESGTCAATGYGSAVAFR